MDKQKFLSLETNKKDRIINAAMSEFRYGYEKASTDAIVQKAGISKGLLFHYFDTKKDLYTFMVCYAMDVIQKDYFDMLNLAQQDILEGYWQTALLKMDISNRYPAIYDFINSVYIHREDIPCTEIADICTQQHEAVYKELYNQCDTSKFRDDIDPRKAVNLLHWAINGFFQDADMTNKDYEIFLEELRNYLDILRLCFYKK